MTAICHASMSAGGSAVMTEIPDLIPGDVIALGTGMTFYGGGLAVSRLATVARVAREVDCGRYEGSIVVTWRARDARGRVIASGREWSRAAVVA